MIMASTEFAEVCEPFVTGRGASSTMPQKRNPISSELMLAACKAVRQHAGLMLDAMVQDFERATGPWHAEWMAIPEAFVLTSGALHQAKFALGGLIVDEARMAQNLGMSKGLIVAEAVMMHMAPLIGRQQAHDVVYAACRVVNEEGGTLAEALAENSEIAEHFDRTDLDRLPIRQIISGLLPRWWIAFSNDRRYEIARRTLRRATTPAAKGARHRLSMTAPRCGAPTDDQA
jgi:3-carboxy-cis,cis-muconate cycloisomerase